jgi:hypothetical protein
MVRHPVAQAEMSPFAVSANCWLRSSSDARPWLKAVAPSAVQRLSAHWGAEDGLLPGVDPARRTGERVFAHLKGRARGTSPYRAGEWTKRPPIRRAGAG